MTVNTDDDAVRGQEVGDCHRFPGELGVMRKTHGGVDLTSLCGDPDRRPRQQGGADDDHPRQALVGGDPTYGRSDDIAVPLFGGIKRADTDDGHGAPRDGGVVAREAEATVAQAFSDKLAETGLVHRQVSVTEPLDARLVHVKADDVVADVRQAGSGNEADVAGADDSDLHRASLPEKGAQADGHGACEHHRMVEGLCKVGYGSLECAAPSRRSGSQP